MKINKISVKYHPTGVEIQDVRFEDTLSLLVGISGVGKTRILNSIRDLIRVVGGEGVNGFEWTVEFKIKNSIYIWKGKFEYKEESPFSEIVRRFNYDAKPSEYTILNEYLFIDNKEVIKRSNNEIYFNGSKTLKLSSSKSIINLLNEEQDIENISNAFKAIKYIDNNEYSEKFLSLAGKYFKEIIDGDDISLELLRSLSYDIQSKLYLCQEKAPIYFADIVDVYKEIFPHVESVKISLVTLGAELEGLDQIVISVKENGVDQWVNHNNISTGMMKTLIHLAYMYLSEQGTVFLIDEFENGFGVNCINSISNLVLNAGNDYQFIMTSHHPYIINNIPVEKWKIVNRTKNIITAESAIKHIDASNHDAFIKLINSNFYTQGIDIKFKDNDLTEDDLYS